MLAWRARFHPGRYPHGSWRHRQNTKYKITDSMHGLRVLSGFRSSINCLTVLTAILVAWAPEPTRAQSATFLQESDPPTFFSYSASVNLGTYQSTTNAPQLSSGYRFAHWSFNDFVQRDMLGHAVNPVHFQILEPTDAIARYMLEDADSNTNSLPDWWELNWLTGLVENVSINSDSDGFGLLEEYHRDYHPNLQDEVRNGGLGIFFSDNYLSIMNTNIIRMGISSAPYGLVESSLFATNKHTSIILPETYISNGFHFCHWSLNGVIQTDPTGRALSGMSFSAQSNTTAKALFVAEEEDSDGDAVADWYEYHFMGSLSVTSSVDGDTDGFDLQAEYERDYHAGLRDELRNGGISLLSSDDYLVIMNTNLAIVSIKSVPSGLVETQQFITNKNAQIGLTNSYTEEDFRFCYWTLNGTVQTDGSGRAFGNMEFNLQNNTIALSLYVDQDEDLDVDAVADWYEYHFNGNLTSTSNVDADADGLDLKTEYDRDYHANLDDELRNGGISQLFGDDYLTIMNTNLAKVSIGSAPAGMVESQQFATNRNAEIILSDSYSSNGFHFCYWTLNGIIQTDLSSRARGRLSFLASNNTIANALFVGENDDTDGDAVADWYEYHFIGNLASTSNVDADVDGFDLKNEFDRDYHAGLQDELRNGGITMLYSVSTPINLTFFPRARSVMHDGIYDTFFSEGPPDIGSFSIAANSHPALGDWDGDGDLDLFVGGSNPSTGSGQVHIFENTGSPVVPNLVERTSDFAMGVWTNIPNPAPALGDWSGDGLADLAVGGDTNIVWLIASSGSWTGAPPSGIQLTVTSSSAVPAFGDLNDDGLPDLLVLTDAGLVQLYPNTGTHTLPYSPTPTLTNLLGTAVPNATGLSTADVNGDGVLDILVSDNNGSIWEFHGGVDP